MFTSSKYPSKKKEEMKSKSTKVKKIIESSEDDDFDDDYTESTYDSDSDSDSDSSDSDETEDVDYETIDSDEESEEEQKPRRSVKKSDKPTKPEKTEKKSEKKNSKTKKEKSKFKHESDGDDEEETDVDEENEERNHKNHNIILSIDAFGGGGGSANSIDEFDYKEMMKEDKHEECDSDDEKMFMKEKYIASNTCEFSNITKIESKPKLIKTKAKDVPVEEKYEELSVLKRELTEQLMKSPNSKILQNAIEQCRRSISELVKKQRKKNTQHYYQLVHKDAEKKRYTNEMSYFKKKLSHQEQVRVMEDLVQINAISSNDKPYRLQLLESKIPAKFKAIVLQKLNVLKMMEPSDSEYYKMKNWVDGFMRIPFGIYKSLSVSLADGLDECHDFICKAKQTLDDCVYGLEDAKLQILQLVGQWVSNPSAMGTAIAIKGPMGTGKTTLVKDGISKILGREFAFIALGGTGDASFLEGHSYTYEGSSWGKVVSILTESKCMNPVIYFDELDKLSDTPKGEEIAGILTHLTDTTQNNQFHDKYFSEVDFDVSKCLFIFSYNDESKINPILKDRMYRIQTKGYEAKEKLIIAKQHLLPKIRKEVNFNESDVVISDEVLQYIIGNDFCKGEQGVRNLKRCLEIIHTKLNLFRLVKSDSKIFSENIKIQIHSFPVVLTKAHVDELVKKDDPMSQSLLMMYV